MGLDRVHREWDTAGVDGDLVRAEASMKSRKITRNNKKKKEKMLVILKFCW